MLVARSGQWAAAALYLTLTVLLAAPLSLTPHRTLFADDPDTHLFMWTLAWDAHALVHQPLSLFDANIFYPNRDTLAYSENLLGSAFFAAPILWLTGNPVLALNVVSLLSCVLCGLGAYVLGRRVGLSAAAALLCGVIFAFSPPRFFRMSQLHLTTVQWIPFALASLHRYLDEGRRRDLHLTAAFFTLQALSSGHGAVFLIVAIVILLACRAVLGEPFGFRRRMADFNVVWALLVLPALLMCLPYRSAQIAVGLRRAIDAWNTAPESFLASPSHVHVWLRSLFTTADPNATATAYLFPGYLPLLLTLVALWPRPRPGETARRPMRTSWTWIALGLDVMAVASLALAVTIGVAGPQRLRIGTTIIFTARRAIRVWLAAALFCGFRIVLTRRVPFAPVTRLRIWNEAWARWGAARRREPLTVYLSIAAISVALSVGPPIGLWPLVYWLPGFDFIRAPSRFMILGVLGIAVVAASGFDRLTARLAPPTRLLSAAIVGALLVVEFAAIPITGVPYRLDIPAADLWLARQPTPFVVAEVPVTRSERYQTSYMLHSMAHWQKTVHGYSGILPRFHEELYAQLREFPSEPSLQLLTKLGVTYVVVHSVWFPRDEWTEVEQRIRVFSSWLVLEYLDPEGRVYSIHRPAHASNAADPASPSGQEIAWRSRYTLPRGGHDR
jgi:hypothetical protein